MKAMVIAESQDAQKLLSAGARGFADEVALVSIKAAPLTGVADIAYDIDLPATEPVDNAFATVRDLYEQITPGVVFIESSPRLKIIAGLLAASADTSVVADVVEFDDDSATSMYFGVLAAKKQKVGNEVKLYMLTGSAFAGSQPTGTDTVEKVAFKAPENPLVLRGTKPLEQVGADLNRAKVVVGAGRGFSEEADLELARDLASKVKGEMACSRPLAENNSWMPRSLYLGVSGRMIAPKVYFAVGISGQMQHMIGVHNADIIIAINKDQNAPVFKQCDYGIVGDLKKVLPELVNAL